MLVYPNAKINIGLNIVSKREDGYHNIETVFYPIGLCDALEIEPSDTCTDYSFSNAGIPVDGDAENNLVIKAYRLLQAEFDISPVDITLVKNIPFGAGLGGGSSDAAFALKALNELFGLNIALEQLEAYAVRLGADCPVFIKNEPVYATGIGNEFSGIELSLEGYFLVLVKPDVFVSTPAAYAGVKPKLPEYDLKEMIKLPVSEWKGKIGNDFELSVFGKFPEIAEVKSKLYESGALYASMSGSGSAVYGLFREEPIHLPDFGNCFVTGGFLR